MANYVVLFLLNDQLFLETSAATEMFGGQVSLLSNYATYCHVLYNGCVLFYLFIHLFLLNISVTSLMSLQRERTNDFKRPSEKRGIDVVCGVFNKCNGFSAEQIIINMSYQEGEIFPFAASKRI